MKKKQILWAVVFGAMLAITGCGDEGSTESGGGSGGTAGSGGSAGTGGTAGSGGTAGGGGDFCTTLCNSCGGGQTECVEQCEAGIGTIPGELDGCPDQLDAVANCLAGNGCDSEACESQWTAWFTCLITSGL